jgi:hypothetical protein
MSKDHLYITYPTWWLYINFWMEAEVRWVRIIMCLYIYILYNWVRIGRPREDVSGE